MLENEVGILENTYEPAEDTNKQGQNKVFLLELPVGATAMVESMSKGVCPQVYPEGVVVISPEGGEGEGARVFALRNDGESAQEIQIEVPPHAAVRVSGDAETVAVQYEGDEFSTSSFNGETEDALNQKANKLNIQAPE